MALLQSLKNYYSKTEAQSAIDTRSSTAIVACETSSFDTFTDAASAGQPIISPRTAALLSIAYTALYVLPFYLSPLTRPSPTLPRDTPTVIRARVRSVTLSCVLCSLSTVYILSFYGHVPHLQVLHLLGWYPISLRDTLQALLLTASLFAGPLFERGVVEGGWREWIRDRELYRSLSSWSGWRNYVAGPFTEELLFRSLLLPLALISQPDPSSHKLRLILHTPLYFGIAHIHHFYEYLLTHPRTPYLPALLVSLFQFAYTTVFGWYAAFVYLRTGNLLGVILCHAFCNWMGLPRLWGRVGVEVAGEVAGGAEASRVMEETVMGERSGGGHLQANGGASPHSRRSGKIPHLPVVGKDGRLGLAWTVAYYCVLFGGVLAFWRGFWVLTRSGNGLVDWARR